jgi:hypothetical protein
MIILINKWMELRYIRTCHSDKEMFALKNYFHAVTLLMNALFLLGV